jgi:hypothetical protein
MDRIRPSQRSRQPAVDALGGGDHGQDADGDAHRPAVDVADLAGHLADPADGGGAPAGHPQDDRDLADDDLDGDPGQDSGDHRGGQELRDPPQAEEADGDQQAADQQAVKAITSP